jgi:hypothetical protein
MQRKERGVVEITGPSGTQPDLPDSGVGSGAERPRVGLRAKLNEERTARLAEEIRAALEGVLGQYHSIVEAGAREVRTELEKGTARAKAVHAQAVADLAYHVERMERLARATRWAQAGLVLLVTLAALLGGLIGGLLVLWMDGG